METEFEGIEFKDKGELVEGVIYGRFSFKVDKELFEKSKNKPSRLKFVISNALKELKSPDGKQAVFVHRDSGIPLIGSGFFGLVDRNTSIIELKPITGCNLNCVFCSVDEGISTRKTVDFVVEKDYLIEEFNKLAESKDCDLEAHIGTHGEPLLYEPLAELIKGLAENSKVKVISMDTNGVLLTKKKVDELVSAGLTRFNLSLNALSPETARKMAGCSYDVEKVKEIAEYISEKSELLVAPVLVQGFNEQEMPAIIQFAKKLDAKIGIQNFLEYKQGRNPARQLGWELFFSKLKQWEQEFKVKLILGEKDFNIQKTAKLPKPFKKGDLVKAVIVSYGRTVKDRLAAAEGRAIVVPGSSAEGNVKLRILRSKHNIFLGKIV